MSYKVDFYKLAILPLGRTGNISQGSGCVYTDAKIEEIPKLLDDFLSKDEKNKCVAVIQKIEHVFGNCI